MRSSYSLKFKKLQKYFTYVFVAINIPKAMKFLGFERCQFQKQSCLPHDISMEALVSRVNVWF